MTMVATKMKMMMIEFMEAAVQMTRHQPKWHHHTSCWGGRHRSPNKPTANPHFKFSHKSSRSAQIISFFQVVCSELFEFYGRKNSGQNKTIQLVPFWEPIHLFGNLFSLISFFPFLRTHLTGPFLGIHSAWLPFFRTHSTGPSPWPGPGHGTD